MPEMTTKQVSETELSTPKLDASERKRLITALNAVITGESAVSVSFLYDKQTKTKARIAGEDYVKLPGVSSKTQMGDLVMVCRRVDNAANRRKQVVGTVYFLVPSATRADGKAQRTQFVNVRPEGVSEFTVTSCTDLTEN